MKKIIFICMMLPIISSLHGQKLFNGKEFGKWAITNFGTEGSIYVEDGEIVLGVGDGLTGITWTDTFPHENYRISLWARKLNGNDFFCGLTFPVRDSHCTFIVGGWGGALVGLSSIDRNDAANNDYKLYRSFETNRWYKITVQVDKKNIIAIIDGEELIVVPIDQHKIDVRSDIALSKPLGIAAWNTKAAIKDIELHMLE